MTNYDADHESVPARDVRYRKFDLISRVSAKNYDNDYAYMYSLSLSPSLSHSGCVSLRWGVSNTGSSSPTTTIDLRTPLWVVTVKFVSQL